MEKQTVNRVWMKDTTVHAKQISFHVTMVNALERHMSAMGVTTAAMTLMSSIVLAGQISFNVKMEDAFQDHLLVMEKKTAHQATMKPTAVPFNVLQLSFNV